MSRIALFAALGVASLGLAGCYGPGYYNEYGYAANGPYYEGYYDGFYGPIDEGFWGPDSYFYYRGPDHHFVRDEGGHFRRSGGAGFQHFRTQGRVGGGHAEGGHR